MKWNVFGDQTRGTVYDDIANIRAKKYQVHCEKLPDAAYYSIVISWTIAVFVCVENIN